MCGPNLHSTKVDLVITAYDRSPSVTAIDVTISCPLLPTHSPAAAVSAAHLFDCRALEKNNKHLAGSIAQGRACAERPPPSRSALVRGLGRG